MPETDCPKCGCNDVVKHGRGIRWGRPWQKYHCNHCGKTFSMAPATQPEPENRLLIVDFYVRTCPHCESDKTRVTHTNRPRRYHECHDCGKTFVSYEKTPEFAE